MVGGNRERILELAAAAIDVGGEAAIRVNHLALEAGVTPPVIYYHFGSRDGLVIAAQIERFSRQVYGDAERIAEAVARCASSDDLRQVFTVVWSRILADRAESRWRRVSTYGSAWGRPELEAAIVAAQDAIVGDLTRMLEPCRDRGWFRPGIDLATAVAWQHGVLLGRVFVERGQQMADLDEWDRLTLESLMRGFFGP